MDALIPFLPPTHQFRSVPDTTAVTDRGWFRCNYCHVLYATNPDPDVQFVHESRCAYAHQAVCPEAVTNGVVADAGDYADVWAVYGPLLPRLAAIAAAAAAGAAATEPSPQQKHNDDFRAGFAYALACIQATLTEPY
jgi:hypothetical protein